MSAQRLTASLARHPVFALLGLAILSGLCAGCCTTACVSEARITLPPESGEYPVGTFSLDFDVDGVAFSAICTHEEPTPIFDCSVSGGDGDLQARVEVGFDLLTIVLEVDDVQPGHVGVDAPLDGAVVIDNVGVDLDYDESGGGNCPKCFTASASIPMDV